MYLQSVKDLTAQNYASKSNKTCKVVGKYENEHRYSCFVNDDILGPNVLLFHKIYEFPLLVTSRKDK